MALKDTVKTMRELLNGISTDLEKASNGNKAASQRVRTGTVKLEKIAKMYRKESIKTEKGTKAPRKAAKKEGAHKAGKAKLAHKPKAKAHAHHKESPKIKHKAAKSLAKPRGLTVRRPTAKLPMKRAHI